MFLRFPLPPCLSRLFAPAFRTLFLSESGSVKIIPNHHTMSAENSTALRSERSNDMAQNPFPSPAASGPSDVFRVRLCVGNIRTSHRSALACSSDGWTTSYPIVTEDMFWTWLQGERARSHGRRARSGSGRAWCLSRLGYRVCP